MAARTVVRRTIAAAIVAAAAVAAGACGAADEYSAAPAGSRETRSGGSIRFDDPELALSVEYPAGWYRLRALTNVVAPRELIALATYPLRSGATGGGPCGAQRDLEAIPPDGALIWLLEFRPLRGDIWAELSRSSFPPRPQSVDLSRADLLPNSCLTGVGYAPRASGLVYTLAFSAAERPLQLSLVFGGRVTEARLEEVERIVDSMSFGAVPPPPADPYAGWPLLNDNPGDSMRPPPGWAATAAMFPPATASRPRSLFFAANRPLFGLPKRLVPYVELLPPSPSWSVANEFPRDGVLVWVREEEKGGASGEYPAIDRTWPADDDFEPVELLTKPNPELRWLRAGGSFRGYRFSVLIGAGPDATPADLELASKSAATLAVSGVCREDGSDCPG